MTSYRHDEYNHHHHHPPRRIQPTSLVRTTSSVTQSLASDYVFSKSPHRRVVVTQSDKPSRQYHHEHRNHQTQSRNYITAYAERKGKSGVANHGGGGVRSRKKRVRTFQRSHHLQEALSRIEARKGNGGDEADEHRDEKIRCHTPIDNEALEAEDVNQLMEMFSKYEGVLGKLVRSNEHMQNSHASTPKADKELRQPSMNPALFPLLEKFRQKQRMPPTSDRFTNHQQYEDHDDHDHDHDDYMNEIGLYRDHVDDDSQDDKTLCGRDDHEEVENDIDRHGHGSLPTIKEFESRQTPSPRYTTGHDTKRVSLKAPDRGYLSNNEPISYTVSPSPDSPPKQQDHLLERLRRPSSSAKTQSLRRGHTDAPMRLGSDPDAPIRTYEKDDFNSKSYGFKSTPYGITRTVHAPKDPPTEDEGGSEKGVFAERPKPFLRHHTTTATNIREKLLAGRYGESPSDYSWGAETPKLDESMTHMEPERAERLAKASNKTPERILRMLDSKKTINRSTSGDSPRRRAIMNRRKPTIDLSPVASRFSSGLRSACLGGKSPTTPVTTNCRVGDVREEETVRHVQPTDGTPQARVPRTGFLPVSPIRRQVDITAHPEPQVAHSDSMCSSMASEKARRLASKVDQVYHFSQNMKQSNDELVGNIATIRKHFQRRSDTAETKFIGAVRQSRAKSYNNVNAPQAFAAQNVAMEERGSHPALTAAHQHIRNDTISMSRFKSNLSNPNAATNVGAQVFRSSVPDRGRDDELHSAQEPEGSIISMGDVIRRVESIDSGVFIRRVAAPSETGMSRYSRPVDASHMPRGDKDAIPYTGNEVPESQMKLVDATDGPRVRSIVKLYDSDPDAAWSTPVTPDIVSHSLPHKMLEPTPMRCVQMPDGTIHIQDEESDSDDDDDDEECVDQNGAIYSFESHRSNHHPSGLVADVTHIADEPSVVLLPDFDVAYKASEEVSHFNNRESEDHEEEYEKNIDMSDDDAKDYEAEDYVDETAIIEKMMALSLENSNTGIEHIPYLDESGIVYSDVVTPTPSLRRSTSQKTSAHSAEPNGLHGRRQLRQSHSLFGSDSSVSSVNSIQAVIRIPNRNQDLQPPRRAERRKLIQRMRRQELQKAHSAPPGQPVRVFTRDKRVRWEPASSNFLNSDCGPLPCSMDA